MCILYTQNQEKEHSYGNTGRCACISDCDSNLQEKATIARQAAENAEAAALARAATRRADAKQRFAKAVGKVAPPPALKQLQPYQGGVKLLIASCLLANGSLRQLSQLAHTGLQQA